MNRRIFLMVALVLVLFAVAAIIEYNKPYTYHGAVIQPPKLMPDFTLQSSNGLVKLSNFRGKFVILYFGYTSCPDFCPTTLAELKTAIGVLDKNLASKVQVVFISVDYKRDTPEKVDAYAKMFLVDFIGLGGTRDQIDHVTKDYGIYYKLDDADAVTGLYAVEHTATVFLLDQQGKLVVTWPYGQTGEEIASDLKGVSRK